MAQPALAQDWDCGVLQSVVISRQRDFDGLFDGFIELKAVSYVTSARLLVDFMENRGFAKVEMLVGENVTASNLGRPDASGPDSHGTDRRTGRSRRPAYPRPEAHDPQQVLLAPERRILTPHRDQRQPERHGPASKQSDQLPRCSSRAPYAYQSRTRLPGALRGRFAVHGRSPAASSKATGPR